MRLHYRIGWILIRFISRVVFRIKVTGEEHLPRHSGYILATNHTSYFDPPLIGSCVRGEVYYLAKTELFRNRCFAAFIRSINAVEVARGTVDRRSLQVCVQVLQKGNGLVVFPEGTRSKTGRLLAAKPGIGMIAARANCPVIPAYLHGADRLGACLLGRQRLSLAIGRPLSEEWVAREALNKRGYQRIAEAVMERIAGLQEDALAKLRAD